MTPERFEAIVEAYGADQRRWPQAEREAARVFVEAHGAVAGPILARADALDDLLFASPRPTPSAALEARVLAAAPKGRVRPWRDRLTLMFGAGWAAAACAGVAAGVMLTAHVTADVQADAVLYQASLGGVDDLEVLG